MAQDNPVGAFRRRVAEGLLLVVALVGLLLAMAGVGVNPIPWWGWGMVFFGLLSLFLGLEWWHDYRRLTDSLSELRSGQYMIEKWDGMVANVYRDFRKREEINVSQIQTKLEPILYGYWEWRSLREAMSQEAHSKLNDAFTRERLGVRKGDSDPIAPPHPFPEALRILHWEISRLQGEIERKDS